MFDRHRLHSEADNLSGRFITLATEVVVVVLHCYSYMII